MNAKVHVAFCFGTDLYNSDSNFGPEYNNASDQQQEPEYEQVARCPDALPPLQADEKYRQRLHTRDAGQCMHSMFNCRPAVSDG